MPGQTRRPTFQERNVPSAGDEFVLPRRIEPERGIELEGINSPAPRIAEQRCSVDVALRLRWDGERTFLRLDCVWSWIQARGMHDRGIEAECPEYDARVLTCWGKGDSSSERVGFWGIARGRSMIAIAAEMREWWSCRRGCRSWGRRRRRWRGRGFPRFGTRVGRFSGNPLSRKAFKRAREVLAWWALDDTGGLRSLGCEDFKGESLEAAVCAVDVPNPLGREREDEVT
jgi:hypothetical protein